MKNRYTYKKTVAATLLGLTILGCGGDKKSVQNESEPIQVSVSEATFGGESSILAGSGQITTINNATLSTRMMGHVERLSVKIGQKVKKGDLLVSINNVDLRAKSAQVEASITEANVAYTNAKKDYERFTNLFRENSASQKEVDDMTARFEMAKARLEAANQMKNEVNSQFAYANIRAPFSGVVTNTYVDEGDMANPGMPLVSVESPGDFEVEAKVDENKIGNIAVGMKAQVFIKALDTTISGKVTELSTSAQNTGGQYVMKVMLDKAETGILSGMYATIRLETDMESGGGDGMVTVPSKALVHQGQLSGIYTVGADNIALLRWLRLGDVHGEEVEVLSGLSKDEKYIVSAEGKLFNGAKVTIQ
ncbi:MULTISPECIES: efflux RND transporter periplasmic adaptor subunit [Flavobacteriaceae]|uniref:efflux RND transporter periplasmic adaptor subunit n=1 Tax=Flavobacteriaceae TaxID=49546 RepID=UPI001491BCE5|nr:MULTISPECIES: efflux RND transporter periplasmic adaptor subunit [Allomuricauda]MDC6366222.1 efflux RND transporter periplasmic adaptor subunit [Muricauda sp. AC10]